MSYRFLVFVSFRKVDLPGACVEEFEGKINKSKLKLVLTNGKIQGYDLDFFTTFCIDIAMEFSILYLKKCFVLLGRRGGALAALMEQDVPLSSSL